MPFYELKKPVYFVGFMGAGKTSVARRLARVCHVTSVDMDTYLERMVGGRIKDLFPSQGEAWFRRKETEVLRELSMGDPRLISCGGGVVCREENRTIIAKTGFAVHLRVTVDEAKSRISDLSTRPLFNDIANAQKISAERLSWYEEVGDIAIDTAGKSIARITGEVQEALEKEGILWQKRE